MPVADGAEPPVAEVGTLVVAAEAIAVARREVDAGGGVVLHPRERPPARLHRGDHALDVFAREALEDVAVSELRVAVEILTARVLVGVAESRIIEAGRHHRLV